MARLKDRVALVTGSSRGIGKAVAESFAAEGAKVAFHGRDGDALARVVATVRGRGGQAIAVTGDVTRLADLEAIRTKVEEAWGGVELLVANAGGSFAPPGREDCTEEGWRASVDGNLTATFLTLKVFLPGMKKRGKGNILTVSSSAGRRVTGQSPLAYAAAKAGVQLLTENVAVQAGPYGIRVNCIAPETILTEANLKRIPEAIQATLAKAHPLQRLGTPADVAQAALFLASDDSSWVTGTIFDVHGGWTQPGALR